MHFDHVAHRIAEFGLHFRVKHDAPLSTAATFATFKIASAIFGHLADLLGTTEDAALVTLAVVRLLRILHAANDSFESFALAEDLMTVSIA
jgi:hypothetical protein